MEIEFIAAGAALSEKSALALVVFEGAVLDGAAGQADAQAGGALARAASAQRFTGAKGQVLD
ncbi:MAG: M17 family peptidase N-terminal domain-containing protein, partial [Phenylobacterium sp.]